MKTPKSSRKMTRFVPSSLLCLGLLMTGSDLTGLGPRASAQSLANLLGYWQFEEGTGGTTADSSGNNLTGTLAGTPLPVWVTPSQAGLGLGALDFSPTARVSIGNPPELQLTGPLTLTAWTLADSLSGSGRVVTKGGNSGNRGWSLGVESAGYYAFQIPGSGTTLASISTAPGTVPLGQWTHLAGVYDPSDLSMKLYINGVLAPTTLGATPVPATMFNPATAVSIGTRSDGSTRWDGQLDEVRIFNRALSLADILSLPELAAVVPEPSTLALCGVAAVLLGLRRFGRVRPANKAR